MATIDKELNLEDKIMNFMIDKLAPGWDPTSEQDSTQYERLPNNQVESIDFEAFKYFNSEYEALSQDNPKIDAMGFERFVKMHRPEKVFTDDLRNFDKQPSSISTLWRDIYGSDTNLMKYSAFEGYKRAIALAAETSKADNSL